jgi:hypothetical protein
VTLPNQYDILRFADGNFEVQKSVLTQEKSRIFCRQCGTEVDERVSLKSKGVVLEVMGKSTSEAHTRLPEEIRIKRVVGTILTNRVPISLPLDVDEFLHDVSQMFGGITYKDIWDFRPRDFDIKGLRRLRIMIWDAADKYGSKSNEVQRLIQDVAQIVKDTK